MSNQRVISIHYTLKNRQGETIDASQAGEPLSFLEGTGQIIPKLEEAVAKMQAGDKKSIEIPAKEGYGERDERLVMEVGRDQLPKGDIKVGDVFRGSDGEHSHLVTVTAVSLSHITVDANHPLAGQDLFFDVELAEVRAATQEELAHGHAHGGDGHHH